MRRRVDVNNRQSIYARAPATEPYWAVLASLVDDGTVNANVMRRDAPEKTKTLRSDSDSEEPPPRQ